MDLVRVKAESVTNMLVGLFTGSIIATFAQLQLQTNNAIKEPVAIFYLVAAGTGFFNLFKLYHVEVSSNSRMFESNNLRVLLLHTLTVAIVVYYCFFPLIFPGDVQTFSFMVLLVFVLDAIFCICYIKAIPENRYLVYANTNLSVVIAVSWMFVFLIVYFIPLWDDAAIVVQTYESLVAWGLVVPALLVPLGSYVMGARDQEGVNQ